MPSGWGPSLYGAAQGIPHVLGIWLHGPPMSLPALSLSLFQMRYDKAWASWVSSNSAHSTTRHTGLLTARGFVHDRDVPATLETSVCRPVGSVPRRSDHTAARPVDVTLRTGGCQALLRHLVENKQAKPFSTAIPWERLTSCRALLPLGRAGGALTSVLWSRFMGRSRMSHMK